MRITNNLLIHNMLWNMNNNLVSMNQQQTQLATGKRINKASDDPVGTTRIIKIKSDIVENEQYKENVRNAQSWLDVSENSLMDTKDILQRVRELAVQGANDTYTDQETDKIAKEIDQLIEELIVNANSTMAGRYLFSGFKTDQPLLNKDGTYNIDVTSEKTEDFESIAYEVAIGEYLPVGTNYLDVYGVLANDNTINDAFVFSNQGYDDAQFSQANGEAATHSKAQFAFDYKSDLTAATTEVKLDGVTYTLDASKLTGNITQEEFIEILGDAQQTNPVVAAPIPSLSSAAELYFVASDDPANTLGELVIEAKKFGPIAIDVSDMTSLTFATAPPETTIGVAEVLPVNAKIEGYFDYGTDLTSETLAFIFGGITYEVDTEEFDGELTEEEFIDLIDNAEDSTGRVLKDVANLKFEATVGTRGLLTLEAKVASDGAAVVNDLGHGFTVFPKQTVGTEGGFNKSLIKGFVDINQDLSAAALGDLSFTIDGSEYVVNTSTMDGSLTNDQLLNVIANAINADGDHLKDVAKISFSNATEPFLLSIEALEPKDDEPGFIDNGSFFTSTPTVLDGVRFENDPYDETSFPTNAKLDGPIDITQDMTGAAPGDLTFTIGDKTYTVDTSSMNGSLTPSQLLNEIASASDGSGGSLGDVAFVTFSNDTNPYELSIEVKEPGVITVSGEDKSAFFLSGNTTVAGIADVDGVSAKITGTLDLETDMTAESLSFTIDGVVYDVPMTNMDGTHTAADVKTYIESAANAGPPATTLSSVATVTVNSTVNPYEFTIESNVATADTIVVNDTGGIFVDSPYVVGKNATNAVITASAKITDDMLSDSVHGVGKQSFVVTYNDETKRIDVDLTDVNTMAELKVAIDAELNIAFGDDGGSPAVNNVSFDLVSNGTNDVIQFTGVTKEDGSASFLKVDVIKTSKSQLIQDLEDFSQALSNKDNEGITKFLGQVDEHLDNVLSVIADIGAKTNRLDFIENRIDDNNIVMTEILSKVQDIDYAEVTIKFKSLESIYRASLSVGAKVIQPTLVDFIQ